MRHATRRNLPRRGVGAPFNTNNGYSPCLLAYLASLFLVMACGGKPGETSGNGDGGSAIGGSHVGGNGTGAGSGSSTTSTSEETCYPTPENGQCAGAASCTCPVTLVTSEDWCNTWPGICPPEGNKCWPGQNACEYDLGFTGEGKPVFYTDPPACKNFVNGSTWRDESGEFMGESSGGWRAGQFYFHVDLIGPGVGYDGGGLKHTGHRVAWHLTNRQSFNFAMGEFSADCMELTMRYYNPGAPDDAPSSQGTIYWVKY